MACIIYIQWHNLGSYNIKACNILLNKVLAPKIAEFGIALLFLEVKIHVSTISIVGTKLIQYLSCLSFPASLYNTNLFIDQRHYSR